MSSMETLILLIEGKRAERSSFFSGLTRKGFQVQSVASGSAALEFLKTRMPQVVLIDAASMRTSGKRICQSIRESNPAIPIVLIVEKTIESLEKYGANAVLIEPFTIQKLLNRIRPLLPPEETNLLRAGSLALNVEDRWVRANGRQVKLTPRLVDLLKILIEHAGEVIERKELFRMVWETDYAGDTRTLDVHISWLRQAMEEDPRNPHFIKTVRGEGYRLDIEK